MKRKLTPKEETSLLEMWRDTSISIEELKLRMSKEFKVSNEACYEYLNSHFTSEERNKRRSEVGKSRSNPSVGSNSQHWKGGRILVDGYWQVASPEWYTGKVIANRVPEHIVVYCLEHNLFEVPANVHIHHRDFDKLNNDPSNLEMLSHVEHARLHSKIRQHFEHLLGMSFQNKESD